MIGRRTIYLTNEVLDFLFQAYHQTPFLHTHITVKSLQNRADSQMFHFFHNYVIKASQFPPKLGCGEFFMIFSRWLLSAAVTAAIGQLCFANNSKLSVRQVDIIDEETGKGIVKDWPNIPKRFEIPNYLELAKAYEYLAFTKYDELTHRFVWSADSVYQQGNPYYPGISILQSPFVDHFAFRQTANFLSQSTVLFPGLISSALLGSPLTQIKIEMPPHLSSLGAIQNLVRMMKGYYHPDFRTQNTRESENGVFTDHFANHLLNQGDEFWFTLIPNVYAMQLQSLFNDNQIEMGGIPGELSFDELTQRAVNTFVRMKDYLKGGNPAALPVFDFGGVDITNGSFRANDQNCSDTWGAGVRLSKNSVLCGTPRFEADNRTPLFRSEPCRDWYINREREPGRLLELSEVLGIPAECYPLSNPTVPNEICVYNKLLQACQVRVDNRISPKYESDTAGSFGLLGVMAYDRWRDPKYLRMADESISALLKFPPSINPFYEVQYSYGVLAAAQLNRHYDKNHNVHQLMKWVFSRSNLNNMQQNDPSTWTHYLGSVDGNGRPRRETNVRPEVGTVNEMWGEFPAFGLWAGKGFWATNGGRAFYMNTIHQAVTLAPIAKYYPEYATLMGKYLLNVASNSKIFFPTCVPKANQLPSSLRRLEQLINRQVAGSSGKYCTNDYILTDSTTGQKTYTYEAIPYESFLKDQNQNRNGIATGDAVEHGWAGTNQSLYSGAVTGFFASILKQTNIPEIPMWDLDATDFQSPKTFPTYLIYNPFREKKMVRVDRNKIQSRGGNVDCSGKKVCAVWDSISHRWLPTDSGAFSFDLEPGQARVLSFIPGGTTWRITKGKLEMTAPGTQGQLTAVIDYNYQ